jgi:gamma-glutamylputrescine oxidase
MNISIWEKHYITKADIIVLGNGIVGLQCAWRLKLKYPKRKVWVLDRAPFSLGASMRNAGFACFGSVGEILDDVRRTNESLALELYEKRFRGLQLLLEDFGESAVGYEKTGGYEVFPHGSENDLQEVLEAAGRINQGLLQVAGSDAFVPKASKSLGMNVLDTAMFTPFEGALQTDLLYHKIREAATSAGVEVYSGVHITGLEQANAHVWKLRATNGYVFECKRLVLCTNGFTRQLLPEIDVEPARGQVLVTSHIPDLKWRGLMHADKGYYYFRSLGTRILIGGARNMDFETENTAEIELNTDIQKELVRFLKEVVVPGAEFSVDEQWAGIMGMGTDRTPVVKEWKPGLFVCARMGGMGVALSASVSRELVHMVQGL